MELEEFLDPRGEDFDVEEPDLSDIITGFSGEDASGVCSDTQDSKDDQDEYIFGPPPNILSRVEAV
ncbi:hypothetical protein N7451_012315 [Penicillium sp. IBT 35674x]|nr:hypothetical protein N7451_012025 [Penicillium sp. IBT 35674x]KAJ5982215.1 hypothetical protein N7451_012315 [Penicillium sp. IBT 35674x]